MIWTEDFNPGYYKDVILGNGFKFDYTRKDGSVVKEDFSGKSVNNYFKDISSGAYSFVGDIVGWVKVPHSVWWYGADPCPGARSGIGVNDNGGIPDAGNAQSLVIDAIEAVKAAYPNFNWAYYDQDGDGEIDRLWIIHAGLGEEDGPVLLDRTDYGEGGMWSHSGSVAPPHPVVPGIKAGAYIMMPENSGISVLAHEFSHNLGADDLYAYSFGETSAGFWTLMADDWTGYPIGYLPPAIDPWHLDNWGWLHPMTVSDPAKVYTVTLGQASNFPKGRDTYRGAKIVLPDGIVPLPVKPIGTYQWWGGQENLTNSMMTLKNPVSIPQNAILSFQTAYRMETGWDFLWVQVSDDGGAHWKTLTNADTACSHDPNWIGGLYGFPDDLCAAGMGGFTGTNSAFPSYGAEGFSLANYAGKSIQLRFWYMTDWGTIWEGPFMDEVQISANGSVLFQDNAESGDSNWNYAGEWNRNNGNTIYTHHYYLQWRNVSSTGGYDSTLGDSRWDFGPANTGLLVWYNNNWYKNNEILDHLFDSPGFGPKGRMLVVDSHPDPYRDPYYVAMGFDNEGANLAHRSLMRDAPFSLKPTVDFTMKPYWVYQETHFSGRPAVSRFNDGLGYYPGAEYANRGPGYSPPSHQWLSKQWDASVVIPSKVFYGIKAPDYTGSEEFRYFCDMILGGGDTGKLTCMSADQGLGYKGGTGNPGDAGGAYGWNVKVLSQTDSKATVRIWNSAYNDPYSCSSAFKPASKTINSKATTINLQVTTSGNDCIVSDPVASDSWIRPTLVYSKGNKWTVSIVVSANTSTSPRTGTVQIGKDLFTIAQKGASGK
jgi:immune inhibitor A